MARGGFIRKTIAVCALTWVVVHFLLSDGQFIQDPWLRWIGKAAVVVIAAWGVVNMLSQRVEKP